MPFAPEVKRYACLSAASRHCCLCKKQCGTKIEAHINDEATSKDKHRRQWDSGLLRLPLKSGATTTGTPKGTNTVHTSFAHAEIGSTNSSKRADSEV